MNTTVNIQAPKSPLWPYLLIGIFFGIVATKGEMIAWFRIHAMFRFPAFHMYGIIGSSVVVGFIAIWLIKRGSIRSADGSEINIPPKEMGKGIRYWAGGIIFGFGWALTGACPGPMFALVGNGFLVILVAVASAVAGAWVYGAMRPKLPH